MNRPAVALPVCIAFIRQYLSGYRGYPVTEAGETRFAQALRDVAISVEHAEAILREFIDIFPTVREIQDQAANLRPKFEPKEDERKEWERLYGPARAIDLNFAPPGEPAYVTRDRKIKEHLSKKHGANFDFAKIGWRELYEAQEACGYPLTREQEKVCGR